MISRICILMAAFLSFATYSNAATILQAQSVSTSGTEDPTYGSIDSLINQSGLSASYVSGVNDFDNFVATTTGFKNPQGIGGVYAPFPVNLDFAFSGTVNLDGAAIWNQIGSASLKEFDLYGSLSGNFDDIILLGSYLHDHQGGLAFIADFTQTAVSAIRMTINSNYGYSFSARFDEIAFRGTISAVPLPAALPLFAAGLIALGFRSFRREKTAA
ncbi:MAG: VPLPA-CTERM sorting domain-containing protein [Sneathiella sp.]